MNFLKLSMLRFCPINKWRVDTEGKKWYEGWIKSDEPYHIEDVWTKDKYLNEGKWKIRGLCGLAVLATPFAQPLPVLVLVAWRIGKLISFYEFWMEPKEHLFGYKLPLPYHIENSFKYRSWQYTKDALRILSSPLVVPMLQISAIYGIIMPYDGRKLYAQTELAYYGEPFLGQCFAPEPTRHLFGGNIKEKGKI